MWDFPRNDVLPGLFCYDVCGLNFFSSKTRLFPYFFRDSSTATATLTVIPTMGLLPAPVAHWKPSVGLPESCENSMKTLSFYHKLIVFGSTDFYEIIEICGQMWTKNFCPHPVIIISEPQIFSSILFCSNEY